MEVPQQCPAEIADIMLACWRKDPKERITFSETRSCFTELKETITRQNVLPLPRPPLETITIVHRALLKNSMDAEDEDKTEAFDDDKASESFEDDRINDNSFDDEKEEDLDEDGYLKPITKSDNTEYWKPL